MWWAVIVKFFQKNWKILAIIVVMLWFMGVFKGLMGRLKAWVNISQMTSSGEVQTGETFEPDYSLMAINMYEALHGKKFIGIHTSENEEAAISIVNSLANGQQYLKLVYMYATKYGKDLRSDLRRYMNDKQYGKLHYK